MTKEIEEKLDVLIKLFSSIIIKDDVSQTESILKLNKIGISNKDIAKILGTTENYVAMSLSRNRKKNGK